jgi:hypothetical protein
MKVVASSPRSFPASVPPAPGAPAPWVVLGVLLLLVPPACVWRLFPAGSLAREVRLAEVAPLVALGAILLLDRRRRLRDLYRAIPVLPLFLAADLVLWLAPRLDWPLNITEYVAVNAGLGMVLGWWLPRDAVRRAAASFLLLLSYMFAHYAGLVVVFALVHGLAYPHLSLLNLGTTLLDGVIYVGAAWMAARTRRAPVACA